MQKLVQNLCKKGCEVQNYSKTCAKIKNSFAQVLHKILHIVVLILNDLQAKKPRSAKCKKN